MIYEYYLLNFKINPKIGAPLETLCTSQNPPEAEETFDGWESPSSVCGSSKWMLDLQRLGRIVEHISHLTFFVTPNSQLENGRFSHQLQLEINGALSLCSFGRGQDWRMMVCPPARMDGIQRKSDLAISSHGLS